MRYVLGAGVGQLRKELFGKYHTGRDVILKVPREDERVFTVEIKRQRRAESACASFTRT